MPMFEYKCQDCLEKFTRLVRYVDSHNTNCPKCDSKNCAKVITRTGFSLKGTGWAKDGYQGK